MANIPLQADWLAIKSLYLSGITLKELSERFSLSLGTLKSRSSREKWSQPPERFKATDATSTEKTAAIISDIWADRAASIREREYKISEKVLAHAEQMPEDQLLAKGTGVEIFTKMGRRSTGLDREESNKNAVNIAVLGEVSLTSRSESDFYKDAMVQPSRIMDSE